MTNDFLPFCPDDTGTNLIDQSDYLVSSARNIGNQPGIASAQLNNKALRQGTYVGSQLAQFISNMANVSTLDNDVPAQFLAQLSATFQFLPPTITTLLTGTGTLNGTVYFFTASGNATAGATYTNNGVTYTVVSTISAGTLLRTTGSGLPTANGGTLTKASGTGDTAITFYAYRNSARINIKALGGGGGGSGSASATNSGGVGGTAGDTTFGSTLIVAGGGTGGATPTIGSPGSATLGSGVLGLPVVGGYGGGGCEAAGGINVPTAGGTGGVGPFGGAGAGGATNNGSNAASNSGAGGGGAGSNSGGGNSGGGGGSGGFVDATILNTSVAYALTYGWGVGAGGAAGAAGSGGNTGGAGGSGVIIVTELFQ